MNINDDCENIATRKVGRAWELILDQCITRSENLSKTTGAGTTIYDLLRCPDSKGRNCKVSYVTYKSHIWDTAIYLFDKKDKLDEIYDPDDMFIICIQIPMGESGANKKCDIRLFHYESHKEVFF